MGRKGAHRPLAGRFLDLGPSPGVRGENAGKPLSPGQREIPLVAGDAEPRSPPRPAAGVPAVILLPPRPRPSGWRREPTAPYQRTLTLRPMACSGAAAAPSRRIASISRVASGEKVQRTPVRYVRVSPSATVKPT